MFMYHGWPKLTGGPDSWRQLGMAMGNLGITFFPAVWGLMSASAEFIGGACLFVGFMTRPICVLMAFNMLVASVFHLRKGDGLMLASHAIESCIVFTGLVFIGSGKYSVDSLLAINK